MLRLFSRQRPAWTVAELARELDMAMPTAYRVANTLLEEGLLERTRARGPLRLGMQVARLGWVAQESNDLRRTVRPYLLRLVAEAGETAVLMVPRQSGAICIDRAEGTSSIRATTLIVGEHLPYNAASLPLGLLAYLPEAESERILNGPLHKLTERTLVDPAALRERCRRIRALGLSFSEQEAVEGAAGLAVPLFGVGDRLEGVVGFTGVIGRVTVALQGPMLRAAGRAISTELGAEQHLGEGSGPRILKFEND